MPPRTRIRRRSEDGNGDGMGNGRNSRSIRRKVKDADRTATCGVMVIAITGEGDSPGEVITRTHAGSIARNSGPADGILAGLLPGKMTFIYESDRQPNHPGWMVSIDREICPHQALGDSLIPLGEPRRLRDLLLETGVTECRWVSTTERRQRQPSLWP